MFTVVIAEKKHIDGISRLNTYLAPVLKDADVHFCVWKPAELTLDDAVPDLQLVVGRQEQWRAVIICEDRFCQSKNPFDAVQFQDDQTPLFARDEKWYAQYRERKFAAYEQAAKEPLTRLTTWLCEQPLTTEGINHAEESDLAFAEYLAESKKKEELRKQLCEGTTLIIHRPTQVFCMAQRTFAQQSYDIRTSWTEHEELHYSRFYDWNLYYDKMRYLIFDILPKNHNGYAHDYLRFLFTMIVFASHEAPRDSLRANRVYALECEDNKKALLQILCAYDNKLSATEEKLSRTLQRIQSEKNQHLTDRQANTIFCARVNIPVTMARDLETEELLAKKEEVGLSTNCPTDEYGAWENRLSASKKTTALILKQPHRALGRAISSLRGMNVADTEQALKLNDLQIEDIEEYTDTEERKMVCEQIPNLYNTDALEKDVAVLDRKIKNKIETRMTKKTTVLLGLVSVLLFVLGFAPLLLNNRQDAEQFSVSLFFLAAAAGLMLIIGFVCLFCLRSALRSLLVEFNDRMREFLLSIEQALLASSAYLSDVCNVMRGFSILNYCKKFRDTDSQKELILRKHICDIQECRAEIRELFGEYAPPLHSRTKEMDDDDDAYLFDFTRPVDYEYALPLAEQYASEIEFLQKENYIRVPIHYLRRIRLHREELFDQKGENV